DARRHHRRLDPHRVARIHIPARSDLRRPSAGRRDQPRAGEDPGRAARGDAGAHGDGGRREPPALRDLHGLRDPEPDRVRGHLSTSGASRRAGVSLLKAARAAALLDGRDYVIPDDAKALAPAVLRHRVSVAPELELEGVTADAALKAILDKTDVPTT